MAKIMEVKIKYRSGNERFFDVENRDWLLLSRFPGIEFDRLFLNASSSKRIQFLQSLPASLGAEYNERK
jgi:hypothetical protein